MSDQENTEQTGMSGTEIVLVILIGIATGGIGVLVYFGLQALRDHFKKECR